MTTPGSIRLLTTLLLVVLALPATALGEGPPAAEQQPETVAVLYSRAADATRAIGTLSSDPDIATVRMRKAPLLEVRPTPGKNPSLLAEEIRTMPEVLAAAPVRKVRAFATVPPNDTRYDWLVTGGPQFRDQRLYLGPVPQYAHASALESVWDATLYGDSFKLEPGRRGITVATMDTGVTMSVIEDSGRFVPVYDYIDQDTDTADANTAGFHGTRVASIIGAQSHNGFGMAGTLHRLDSRILVYRVLQSDQSGDTVDVMTAMMDAADRGAKIISLSLGHRATLISGGVEGTVPDLAVRDLWQQVVDYCAARGSLVVAASGNDGATSYPHVLYPAACQGVLTVGSLDPETGQRSTFSSYGPEMDVVTAGQYVWTLNPGGVASNTRSGTSFAAPLVSGSLAYAWSLVPDLSRSQMLQFARQSADDSYGPLPGFDNETGYGRFDAYGLYGEMTRTVSAQAPVALTVDPGTGLEVSLSWTAAAGANVTYAYGYEGGPEYATTARTGRLPLSGDTTHTVYVRSTATDRWGVQAPASQQVKPATGLQQLTSVRHEGADRYRTAAAISEASYPVSAPALVIASGQNWPDGLTASALAAAAEAPVLLTRADRLSLTVRDEIMRLGPQRIYIVGGEQAVSRAVEDAIDQLPHSAIVTRLAGSDRYDTARLVAIQVRTLLGSLPDGRVIVASGENYPDALSTSSLSAAAGYPILLSRRGSIPSATSRALSTLGPTSSLIIGGEQAISSQVAALLPSPVRLAGMDRYETSRVVAGYGVGSGVLTYSTLGVATGRAFPDSLAAGPLLGMHRAPLILADGSGPRLETWLRANSASVESLRFLGGPAAVPYDLEFDIKAALRRP